MLHVHKIASLDLPELEPYRTLRRPDVHRQQRIFVVDGEKILRRLLLSRFALQSVLLTEEWFSVFESALRKRSEAIAVYLVGKPLLEKLVGFTMFQGVLAVARIPELPTLETILKASVSPGLFVATDGVSNAENLGTLVRNCAAFSVQALLISQSSSSPFLRRAVRSSMGGIFQIPVLENLELAQTLAVLRENNFRCIAAHPHSAGKILPELNLRQNCCLVFGNEAQGISPEVLAACDDCAAVPMPPGVDSMNVSNAAAVFLYETWRQRAAPR
ncbi:MAG: RNA methyltransferase [Verrucomicrobiota bacterium]